MKRFLIQSTFFAFIVLSLYVLCEILLFYTPNEYNYKKKYIENHGESIKVLILGHSHTARGLNPRYMGDSVFNMAINARSHYYDAVIAERYIPTLENLQCVIWPLGYNLQYVSFEYPCVTGAAGGCYNKQIRCMYEKYMNISVDSKVPYKYWSEIYYFGLARIRNISLFDEYAGREHGYVEIAQQFKQFRPDTWQSANLPSIVDYDSPNVSLALSEGISNLKRIASSCKESGVRLIVITTPCHKSFLDLMTERGKADMNRCVDTMKLVYPNMEYYNYIFDARFEDEDFFDSSHLSDIGAQKFTKILWQEHFESVSSSANTNTL